MTLRQTKSGWQARYRWLDGKERARNFRLKSDAQAWLEENKREVRLIRAGLRPDPTTVEPEPERPHAGTVVETVTEWLNGKETLGPRTRRDYESLRDSLIVEAFEDMPVQALTAADVRGWIEGMYGRGLSQSRVKQGWAVLSQALKWAWAAKVIDSDPAREAHILWPAMLRPPRGGGSSRPVADRLTPEQVESLAVALGDYGLMARLGSLTGLRWGEVSALQVKHVDLLGGRVLVRQAFTRVGPTSTENRGLALVPPKSGQPREVPLVTALRKPLEARVEALGHPEAYLFTRADDGLPFTWTDFRSRHWRPALTTLEWSGVGFHDLRKFFASQHASRGVPPIVLAKLLGHADAGRLALNLYASAYASDVTEAMAGLEASVSGRISG